MKPAIEIENLSFSYEGPPVLKDITVNISPKTFTVILGRNGCGKSTLFKVLTGIERYRQGRVAILGEEVSRLSSRGRARLLGYLPQHHRPIFPFSVADIVLTGRASHVAFTPRQKDRELAEQALERVGIGHLKDRPFTELSGGEQQMVMIARVMAQEPKVILLDEPTSHLDVFNQAMILRLARDLVDAGLTVVAVLHDPTSAFLFADEFILIKNGGLLKTGPSEKPWDLEVLRRLYEFPLTTIPYKGKAIVVA